MEEELRRPMCQMSDRRDIRSNLNLGEIGLTNSRVSLVVVRVAAFIATPTLVALLYARILATTSRAVDSGPQLLARLFCARVLFVVRLAEATVYSVRYPRSGSVWHRCYLRGTTDANRRSVRRGTLSIRHVFAVSGCRTGYLFLWLGNFSNDPSSFLFLAVPLPAIILNQISFPLELDASRLATVMLAFLGVPVLREGKIIALPSLSLDVAEACSGLHSLVSLITLAARLRVRTQAVASVIFDLCSNPDCSRRKRLPYCGCRRSRKLLERGGRRFCAFVLRRSYFHWLLTLHSAMRRLGKSASVGPS